MGGCSDCTKLGGCSARKGEERELLAAILPHLYPTRRWGEPDDLVRHGAGVGEREGRSLATTSHEVIRQWAEERGGTPATVEGTEHGDHLGVLRFDFGGGSERLRQVSWDEWFETFDARRLNFLYQETRKDGQQSNFFRLESPDREDA